MDRPIKKWRRKKHGQSDVEFLVEAIDDHSRNMGKWLAEIAEAISTSDPDEIKTQAARVKALREQLQAAVETQGEKDG